MTIATKVIFDVLIFFGYGIFGVLCVKLRMVIQDKEVVNEDVKNLNIAKATTYAITMGWINIVITALYLSILAVYDPEVSLHIVKNFMVKASIYGGITAAFFYCRYVRLKKRFALEK